MLRSSKYYLCLIARQLFKMLPHAKRGRIKTIFIAVASLFIISFVLSTYTMMKRSISFEQVYPLKSLSQGSKSLPLQWPQVSGSFVENYLTTTMSLEWYFAQTFKGAAPLSAVRKFDDSSNNDIPLGGVLIYTREKVKLHESHISKFFERQRLFYQMVHYEDPVPALLLPGSNRPLYSLVVLDNYFSYLEMRSIKKDILETYCRKFKVGMIAVANDTHQTKKVYDLKHLKLVRNLPMKGFKLNRESQFWRVARSEQIYQGELQNGKYTAFLPNHETYTPLVFSTLNEEFSDEESEHYGLSTENFGCTLAVYDRGTLDGVERVILGGAIDFWLNSLVAVDAVGHLSHGSLLLPLTRYVEVDVDDMFVGHPGLRTHEKDAEAMAKSQEKIREYFPDFRYALGYSGDTYDYGSPEEVRGAKRIVELADQFPWFNHMKNHLQPHLFNYTKVLSEVAVNFKFAEEYNLPVVRNYVVAPLHSGVYPPHEPFYVVMQETGITVTSSSTYPENQPEWKRRGFVYKGIKVVPRMSCGLFTSINFFEEFRGGKAGLNAFIKGGELFKKILFTPVLVFMSHMTNYANDQLAEHVFEGMFRFVTTWTNLNLVQPKMPTIADIYFQMYPEEASSPFWMDPCRYAHHKELWAPWKQCGRFPSFVIGGPDGTGVSALDSYLSVHPELWGRKQEENKGDFDFFSTENYDKGLDWYIDHFVNINSTSKVQYEKSASYFESHQAPKRIFKLIPEVKLIFILSDPARRAHAWYQHKKYSGNHAALRYSFMDVLKANSWSEEALLKLRDECLITGLYARHLTRYLMHFNKHQILIVDGDELMKDPNSVLEEVQVFLELDKIVDYSKLLRFDEAIGAYCLRVEGCVKDNYRDFAGTEMDEEALSYLRNFYKNPNSDLRTVLEDLALPLARFLEHS